MESPAPPKRQLQARKARRVLPVEEDEEQRFALKARLVQLGFQVTVALDDVSMAWSLEFCHYDAMVVDLGPPESLKLEVLTEFARTSKLPSTVILTGGDECLQNLALTLATFGATTPMKFHRNERTLTIHLAANYIPSSMATASCSDSCGDPLLFRRLNGIAFLG